MSALFGNKLMSFLRNSALLLLSFFCLPAYAAVTSAFDGNWYDPNHPGQGFIFETYPLQGGDLQLVVIYFAYDAAGNQAFYTASAPITGSVVPMTLLRPTIRGALLNGTLPTPIFEPAGTLTIRFFDCRVAAADVVLSTSTPRVGPAPKVRVGTGSFRLARLGNSKQANRCTGGISDDSFAGDAAEGFDRFFSTPQLSVHAVFQRRPDATELRLDIRDLPTGSYKLEIGGVPVEGFNVSPYGNGTRGEVRYRSPMLAGQRLLDFDAVGQSFVILGAEPRTALVNQQIEMPRELTALGSGAQASGGGNTSLRYDQTFNAAQVNGYGRGIQASFLIGTTFERTAKTQEFRVTVEGAEAGIYDVYVAGQRRGQIELKTRPNGQAFGEVFFRSPVTIGAYPLDFDPRGTELQLRREQAIEYAVGLPN